MKTTIELPDQLVQRAKVAAARRNTTLKMLVRNGLEMALREENAPGDEQALNRLRQGYHLGGAPMTREEVHERGSVS